RVALGVSSAALVLGGLMAAAMDSRTPAAIVFGIAWLAAIAARVGKALSAPTARAPWTLFAIGLTGQAWSSLAYFVDATAAAAFPSADDFALLFYPTSVVATV